MKPLIHLAVRLAARLAALSALLGPVWLAPAAAARDLPCNKDFVGNVDGSGRFIRLGSGQLFEVYPGDDHASVFWQPLDKVTVCALGGAAARITDLDPRRGSVRALRQYSGEAGAGP